MAQIAAFANNIFEFPVYGLPFVVVFPILDNTGEPVADAADLAAVVSLNGDTFGASVNTPAQIPTSSGLYYLELSDAETEAEIVAVKVTTSTADAKSTCLTLYPKKIGLLDSGTILGVLSLTQLLAGSSHISGTYNGAILHIDAFDGKASLTRLISNYTVTPRGLPPPNEEYRIITVSPNLPFPYPSGGAPYQIYALAANMGTTNISESSISEITGAVTSIVGGIIVTFEEDIDYAFSTLQSWITSSLATYVTTIVQAVWDYTLEGTLTTLKSLRIMLSTLAGKSTGGGSNNFKFRNTQDTKDRVNEIVDLHGNRTHVTLDGD